ncbi:MAG: MgtC/SapB family protein [Acidobacteriota bacterium]
MELLDLPEGRLAVALGIGLVIGAERERRKGEGPSRRGAGIRTFAIVALLGGVVAMLHSEALLVISALVVGAIAIVSYWLGDRDDPGVTSEVTLVLTYILGALAEREPRIALATGICVAALLALRAPLHRISRNVLSEDELRDALLFAVAAVVVLPLLPDRAIDPFGVVNPFTLWRLVVVLMAMSGAGYIAQRVLGPRYGLALAGLGGGFVSSSATIAAMGARTRSELGVLRPAVAGAAASTVSTFMQLAILAGTASPALLAKLAWPLSAGGLVAALYAAIQTWHGRRADAQAVSGRAFRLSTALLFGSLVTLIGFVSTLARSWLGAAGTIATAALAGFADAHSSTAAIGAMSVGGHLDERTAVFAILLALTTNTITKGALAATSGSRRYAVLVGTGLVLVLGTTWLAALL